MNFRQFAIATAEKASQIILKEMEDIKFEAKNPYDVLAKADLESEKFVLKEIFSHFPSHSVWSEEKGDDHKKAEYKWVVDPLDGTVNFSQGLPDFCISMALLHKNEVILGVIYQPLLKDWYVAERGKGCFLNKVPIRVSQKKSLIEMVGATESSTRQPARLKNLKVLTRLGSNVKTIRICGSAALNLARLAAGKLDFYFNNALYYWDVAAGTLLLKEAGGVITDLAGEKISVNSKNILGCNQAMHEQIRKLITDS